MSLYENVKNLCNEHGVPVAVLEKNLGFARSSICKWNTNVPSIVKVKKVADYFHIAVDELMKEESGEKKNE